MSRPIRLLAAVLCLVAIATGCRAKEAAPVDLLRSALRETEVAGRTFRAVVEGAHGLVVVEGAVEDDLRYRAELSVDGVRVYEEVVSDDAIAARLHDPEALDLLRATGPDVPDASSGQTALREGRWVLDQLGAPDLLAPLSSETEASDPVRDALHVLRRLEQAISEAALVVRHDTESVAYRPKEDRFEPADADADETRFDLVAPRLPRPQDVDGAGQQPPPAEAHLRKVAVYVRGGVIVRIAEVVDVAARLGELQRAYGITVPPGVEPDEAATLALAQVNRLREERGKEPVVPARRTVEFVVTEPTPVVALPADAVVAGLSFLRGRGSTTGRAPAIADDTEEPGPRAAPPERRDGDS